MFETHETRKEYSTCFETPRFAEMMHTRSGCGAESFRAEMIAMILEQNRARYGFPSAERPRSMGEACSPDDTIRNNFTGRNVMETRIQNQHLTNSDASRKRADAVGGGVLFIWIGIAVLAHAGWGTGLLGVGFIILGIQATRVFSGLKRDGFGVIAGLFFVLGGTGELFHIRIDFIPILCVVAGVSLLGSALINKAKHQTDMQAHTR